MRAAALAAVLVVQSAGPPMRVLDHGQQSAIEKPRTVVASTVDAIAALWREHSHRPQPPVDASRESVVAVFLGSRPSAGYAAEIVSVKPAGADTLVQYRERKPPPDAVTAQILTFPYSIVAVPRVTGAVRFERID
jgi:hypothetical protein